MCTFLHADSHHKLSTSSTQYKGFQLRLDHDFILVTGMGLKLGSSRPDQFSMRLGACFLTVALFMCSHARLRVVSQGQNK